MTPLKSGVFTSEFFITMLVNIGGAYLVKLPHAGVILSTGDTAMNIALLVIAGLVNLGYINSRKSAKVTRYIQEAEVIIQSLKTKMATDTTSAATTTNNQ